MPIGRHYKVRCGKCGSMFNKDYTNKHCRSFHKSYDVHTLPTLLRRESNQSSLSSHLLTSVQYRKQIEQPSHPALIAKDNQHDHLLDEERQLEEIQSPQSEIEQPNKMLSDEAMLEDTSPGCVNIRTTSDSPNSDTDADDPDVILSNSDTEDVVTCYGKLRHLADAIGKCQELLYVTEKQLKFFLMLL